MKWGIVCNYHVKKACSLADEIYDFLSKKYEVFAEDKLAKIKKTKGYSLEELDKKADIIVTVGGDGTILRAIEKTEKPIFAINSGGMGFLSEVEAKYAKKGLERVIKGDYNIEERAKLKILVDGKRLPDAANEVTVQTAHIAKMIYLEVLVENEIMESYGGDGVIVSTPTGSTSYAMSVGGPVLDPTVSAMVIAPLAPFKLSARPWVVPLNKKVGIRLLPKSKETMLVIDGENPHPITQDSKIAITGSEKKARFVRFGESFYQMFRLKLVR
jgi:NAD+ kinase